MRTGSAAYGLVPFLIPSLPSLYNKTSSREYRGCCLFSENTFASTRVRGVGDSHPKWLFPFLFLLWKQPSWSSRLADMVSPWSSHWVPKVGQPLSQDLGLNGEQTTSLSPLKDLGAHPDQASVAIISLKSNIWAENIGNLAQENTLVAKGSKKTDVPGVQPFKFPPTPHAFQPHFPLRNRPLSSLFPFRQYCFCLGRVIMLSNFSHLFGSACVVQNLL